MLKKLSPKLKKALKEIVGLKCQNCKKIFKAKELEIHRIKRGASNGDYLPNNILILCSKCHKDIHYGE